MAQMVARKRTRKSDGPRSHTLKRRQILTDLLKTPKAKREPFEFVDEKTGEVVATLGSGFTLTPQMLDIEGARSLSFSSTRTAVYSAAKAIGVEAGVHEWTDGTWAVVIK